jgi:hypothetical protein
MKIKINSPSGTFFVVDYKYVKEFYLQNKFGDEQAFSIFIEGLIDSDTRGVSDMVGDKSDVFKSWYEKKLFQEKIEKILI